MHSIARRHTEVALMQKKKKKGARWVSERAGSLYLEYDPAADHPGGDVLLLVQDALRLTQLTVQLLVHIGKHWEHWAAGDVQHILAADDQEGQQHQAEEQLCHQGPHGSARG